MLLNKKITILLICNVLFAIDYCPSTSISQDVDGSRAGAEDFKERIEKSMEEISENIKSTSINFRKINQLQSLEYINTTVLENTNIEILKDLKEINYLYEKQNLIKESKLDMLINKLNSKIIQLELLLSQLKNKK